MTSSGVLHIMDWTEHERFNTPWLNAFAAGGLVFAVAGAILLFMRWPRRRAQKSSRGPLESRVSRVGGAAQESA